jgi:hypothetical protein
MTEHLAFHFFQNLRIAGYGSHGEKFHSISPLFRWIKPMAKKYINYYICCGLPPPKLSDKSIR